MKSVRIFIICTTILTQFIFSMELPQTNYFGTAAGDAKKQIFLALLNTDVANKFVGFKELLKCRRVCKEWLQNVDAVHKIVLQQEQAAVDEYYKEKMKTMLVTDEQLSKWFSLIKNERSYRAFDVEKEKQQEAVKHNHIIWMHHSLKNCQACHKLEGDHYHTNLIAAATLNGSIAMVDLLIAMKIDVNRDNPLESAISNGQTMIAKRLIETGAALVCEIPMNYNLQTYYYTYDALKRAEDKGNKELAQFILEFQKNSKKRAVETSNIVTKTKKQRK